MALKVQTLITNKARTPYSAVTAKGRKVAIRGGETIKLPYDLYSVIGSMEQREYARLTAKGLLEIKTEVTTNENTLTITPTGDVKISAVVEEPAKELKKTPLTAAERPKTEKPKTELGASGVIASKGAEKLAMGLGATTESVAAERIKEVELKDGKVTEINTPGVQVTKNTPQPVEEKAINIFPNGTTEVSEVDSIKAKKEEDAAALVNVWLKDKDYTMLYAWLNDNYPTEFAATTKTAVKKCKTFEDLRTLLNI